MRPPDQRGFTLIEVLLVIVVLGILAAVAIPKYSNSKDQSYRAVLKGDLRNLAVSQEAYLYEFRTYYDGAVPGVDLSFDPSPGVSIELSTVSSTGWAAQATHDGTGKVCALYYGAAPALAPATVEGEVACEP